MTTAAFHFVAPVEAANGDLTADTAREERPARVLVHVGGGELLEIVDAYRLHVQAKES
ncbi:hypothetical protein ABZS76_32915 [Streptomyces sp. NPDC005562]|uniref:hypothetical protein n=1 Tax=Streptomyces sp. NPDC005562 TaxID=3154890 RepID=UPI0033A7EFEB